MVVEPPPSTKDPVGGTGGLQRCCGLVMGHPGVAQGSDLDALTIRRPPAAVQRR